MWTNEWIAIQRIQYGFVFKLQLHHNVWQNCEQLIIALGDTLWSMRLSFCGFLFSFFFLWKTFCFFSFTVRSSFSVCRRKNKTIKHYVYQSVMLCNIWAATKFNWKYFVTLMQTLFFVCSEERWWMTVKFKPQHGSINEYFVMFTFSICIFPSFLMTQICIACLWRLLWLKSLWITYFYWKQQNV